MIEASFINADFRNLDQLLESRQDIIWIGFSLHHLDTPDKLEFMSRLNNHLTDKGVLLIYEPILIPGEDQAAYLRRFQKVFDEHWSGLTQEEGDNLLKHVRETEKPETTGDWIKLGLKAGFSIAEKVFSERTGLYEIFMYRK